MSHHYSGPDFSSPRGDARLDLCDFFAFPKPGDMSTSVLIMDAHPSVGVNPPGPTTPEPFAPEAIYELKIDTDGDHVADIAYRVRFSSVGGNNNGHGTPRHRQPRRRHRWRRSAGGRGRPRFPGVRAHHCRVQRLPVFRRLA